MTPALQKLADVLVAVAARELMDTKEPPDPGKVRGGSKVEFDADSMRKHHPVPEPPTSR